MNKQIEEIVDAIEFQLIVANATKTPSIALPAKYGMFLLDLLRKQSEGEWVIVEYEYVTCSKCGHYHWSGCDSTAEAKERLAKGDVPNFCPNCGAKMEGGE